jgi:formylmethanofuran dehydrogenase subunit E-like metal-binding protein
MEIQNSLDWQKVNSDLSSQLSVVGYNPDLHRMLSNINKMVSELSSLEVEARRKKSTHMTQEKVDTINKAINHLEKLILMATLMR